MKMPTNLDDALDIIDNAPDELLRYLDASSKWAPLPGPQLDAWTSEADELFYGGAAGGGKTDFVCGLALEQHQVSIVYRREAPQLAGITDRLSELLGGRDMFHAGDKVWRPGNQKQVEYGSMPNPGDEQRYQGRPHDLLVFDEITQFTRYQYTYLRTWNRHASNVPPSQRCRIVVTGNPPTTPEGQWVREYWGPWLDPDHPLYGKVKPGELVWYVTSGDMELVVDSPMPWFYEAEARWITPKSRTFIPAQVEDNPFLMRTGYDSVLDSLPEPLRSMMRHGDFAAGNEDDAFQVIPSSWVDAAQTRWKLRSQEPRPAMSAMGVDVSRGGRDLFVLTPRYGAFIGSQIDYPGTTVENGKVGAGLVLQHLENKAPCNVDVVNVGNSVVDFLEDYVEVNPIHGAAKGLGTDKSGKLKFANLRAKLYWTLRELLDPTNPDPICLPPTSALKADLCAPRFKVTAHGIQLEDKDLIKRRLGRSPDWGDSCVYAIHDYENAGLMSQQARVTPVESGSYRRPGRVVNAPGAERARSAYLGFNETIDYGDE